MVDQSGGGMRRQLYKRMVKGQEGLWDELRREVKHLVMEKIVEKANADEGILVICR